jgi:hypothetical protein
VCKDRKDLTEDTKFMLEILRNSNTIEEAIHIISRKLDLTHKVFSKIRKSIKEIGHFASSFLRNLDCLNYGSDSLFSLEFLLQCQPYDLSKELFDYTISFLYPSILFHEVEFRERYLNILICCNLQWLSPLLVLIDYLEFYQDETETMMS